MYHFQTVILRIVSHTSIDVYTILKQLVYTFLNHTDLIYEISIKISECVCACACEGARARVRVCMCVPVLEKVTFLFLNV